MNRLSGKRILITGATGLVGGRLAERLLKEEGAQVRALVRQPAQATHLARLGVELVTGDITQPDTLLAAVQGCHLLFHAAAWVKERGPRRQIWAVNVGGTQNMVNAALSQPGLERFVQISSCAVYGSVQRHNITEQTPIRAWRMLFNSYSASKAAAETVVWRAYRRHGLPVVVARASQIYGPRSQQFTVRPVQAIKAGRMMLINRGRHLCKPIYIDNLVDGLLLCATVPAAVGEAINFTDDRPVSWRDFFGAYGQMLNVTGFPSVPYPLAWVIGLYHEIKALPQGKKAKLNRRVVRTLRSSNSFSNQKAKDLLQWTPQVDFTEGMCRTEAWLRQEGYIEG